MKTIFPKTWPPQSWHFDWRALFPFLSWWHLVTRQNLRADAMAGLTGAVIVLPQGVAFATIAGLPPEYGLYTAMVTPVIAALFGSSFHLISGPTTAISIVIFSAVSQHAEPGTQEFVSIALTLTFLAGVYQLAFGLAYLGRIVNFVSHTVITGFTAGAAILIATSQMRHALGLELPRGESFLHTWLNIADSLHLINPFVVGIALVTLLAALAAKKYFPRLPNLLIAMVIGSLIAAALGAESHNIALIGEIPRQLPPLSSPDFSLSTIRALAPEAFAIALLGLIEAVSIAKSIAVRSQQRINPNQEFIGQGLSNIGGSFLSSYAGSGSFTRSGLNYESGAKTPLSALFAAAFLAIIVLAVAPLTKYLPIPAMAGIILLVAWNLIDFHHIRKTLQISKSESAILLTTFLATLFLELEFAIYMGVLLSLIFFLMRTSTPEIVSLAPDPDSPQRRLTDVASKPLQQCPQLKIIRVDMSIYFGSLDHIEDRLIEITENERYKHILILGSGINFIDMAGAEMLVHEARRLRRLGGGLYMTGVKSKVCGFLKSSHFDDEFGRENLFVKKEEAIREIFKRLDPEICRTCPARIFIECTTVDWAKPATATQPATQTTPQP